MSWGNLAGLGGDLGSRALGTLLGGNALSTTLGGSVLGLVGLLLGSGGGLLLLGVGDGLLASSLTGLGALGAALLDNVKGGTDDSTLVLHDTASALLGNLLYVRERSVFHFAIARFFLIHFIGNDIISLLLRHHLANIKDRRMPAILVR